MKQNNVIFFVFCIVLSTIGYMYADQDNIIKKTYTLSVTLTSDDYIYYDTIHISSNHPFIRVDSFFSSIEPIVYHDSLCNNKKLIIPHSFLLHITITIFSYDYQQAHLYVRYYQRSKKKFVEHFIPVLKNNVPCITTISIQKKEKTMLFGNRKRNSFLFPTWWQDMYTVVNFLFTTYEKLFVLLWILLGFLICFTPFICPTLAIITNIIFSKKKTWSFFHIIMYGFFHFIIMYIVNNIVIVIMPHITHYIVWYMHFAYSCIMIFCAIYVLQWHLVLTAYLIKKKLFFPIKHVIFWIVFSFGQAICLYPIVLFFSDSNAISFHLLLLQLSVSIPLYFSLINQKNKSFLLYMYIWSQEVSIAFGYLLLYGTMFIWYYTETVSVEKVLFLTACITICIGVWYIKHAQQLTFFWSYIARIIGIISCASSVTIFFYAYKVFSIRIK